MYNTADDRPNIAFFGTPDIAVVVLETLSKHGLAPSTVVTAPDRKSGRGMKQTPPAAKKWADEHDIPVLQPEKLDEDFYQTFRDLSPDIAIVAAYGMILPKELLDIPPHGFINVHPSLLPEYRGASPVESAVLSGEEKTGVTIMLMDEQMDHGPILGQRAFHIADETAPQLREILGRMGAELIAEILPDWMSGKLKPIPQNHDEATFTKKIQKQDGELDLDADPQENLRKVRALADNPGTFCFIERDGKSVRVAVKNADVRDLPAQTGGVFVVTRAIPSGKKEMSESEFQTWLESGSK